MSNRILITGAQGFIGPYTVAHILETMPGAQVMGLGRSGESNESFTHRINVTGVPLVAPLPANVQRALASDRYRYTSVDLLNKEALTETIRGFQPDVVIHLAAALRGESLETLLAPNVQAVETLYEAISASGVTCRRVVFGSSGSIYGRPEPGQLPVSEQLPANPFDFYSISKHAGERVAEIMGRRFDIETVSARIFNVVGPGQDERHICGWIARQLCQRRLQPSATVRLGTLTTTRDFVDVRDVARGLATLIENGEPGVYNLASGVETSMQEILDTLCEIAGGAYPTIEQLPPRPEDNPRMQADVSRLFAAGHTAEFSLAQSLRDVFDYYSQLSESEQALTVPATKTDRLHVTVSRTCEYPILASPNLLDELPAQLDARYPNTRLVVLTDTRVWDLYGQSMVATMESRNMHVSYVVIPEGDASKAFEVYRRIIEQLYERQFDRRAVLVNLGGGLICDVGGFVASSYLRGVRYVNVPTTLLAQCDAAIGGKVAVNTPWAKNFVGSFHHPDGVYSDPCSLRTLGRRDIAAGVAEMIKVAVMDDPRLFDLLDSGVTKIMDELDPAILQEAVLRASASKIRLLDPDPYETDLRRVLNFGHTYGHPLETEFGYGGIKHGEAVGWGMAVSTAIAAKRGLVDQYSAERIYRLIGAYDLPPAVPKKVLQDAVRHIEAVRLVRANKLNFVFPTGIGSSLIVDEVSDQEFLDAIDVCSDHHAFRFSVHLGTDAEQNRSAA